MGLKDLFGRRQAFEVVPEQANSVDRQLMMKMIDSQTKMLEAMMQQQASQNDLIREWFSMFKPPQGKENRALSLLDREAIREQMAKQDWEPLEQSMAQELFGSLDMNRDLEFVK